MKRTSTRAFLFMLCFAIIFGPTPVSAVSQGEIDALEAQRDELREKMENVSEQLTSLESDLESILRNKAVLDEESAILRQDIQLISQQLSVYASVAAEKLLELKEAEKSVEEHYNLYCKRVRAMEERSSWTYISYVLKADSISDLLSRMNDVSDVMKADKKTRENYINAQNLAREALLEYEEILAAEQSKLKELVAVEVELKDKITKSSNLIEALEADIDTFTSFQEITEAKFAEVQALVDRKAEELRKQQEAEAALKNSVSETQLPSAAGGYFLWPSSCTRISSPFGPRQHPIYGQLKPHTGVDIAAWYGTEIYAAADGTVSSAVLDFGSVGYGSYVAIYHPNGSTTLYAHMSSLAVNSGQHVKQGQIIGYVGSTGASNGPHIHFEIRQNGVCVNPLPYFNISFS